MHVLVTGGAGYIGSITAELLLKMDCQVTVLDDLSRGKRELVPERCKLVVGDVGNKALVERAALDADACIHFAGFIDAAESVENPKMYLQTNGRKTEALLEALSRTRVERFVLSSSAAVYGIPTSLPIPVDHHRNPVNPYGESKAQAEDAVVACADRFHYAVLRYFNAAGATSSRGEEHVNESHLIPRVLDVAMGRRECITVNGTDYPTRDGTCVRDYVHVVDLADAHVRALAALEHRATITCNVGTGSGFTVNEVIDVCRSVSGHPIPLVYGERRPGDVPELVADPTEAGASFGWTPHRSQLSEIVSSAWDWHSWRFRGIQGQRDA